VEESEWNGKSPSHKQNVESMIGLTLRLYEKTAQPNPLLPPLRFERADSRCRYLLFCLSTVQLACASKMENPDAVLNECAQAVLSYCLADQPTYFGGDVNPQAAVNQVAPCLQDFLQQWSKYVDMVSGGNRQEVLNIISAMIRDTESSAPAGPADAQRLRTVALYVEASLDRTRAQFK
jgi:hypothetical protein